MIANCTSCGTHYKHEPPKEPVRARCGRCYAALELSPLSPYRLVSSAAPAFEPAGPVARQQAIGLDDPPPAISVARIVGRPLTAAPAVRPPDIWEDDDPLPQIPEMTPRGDLGSLEPRVSNEGILGARGGAAFGHEAPRNAARAASVPGGGGVATLALWLATGAIAGTGTSWTMGGTTATGLAAGTALGAIVGWGWLRWASPK